MKIGSRRAMAIAFFLSCWGIASADFESTAADLADANLGSLSVTANEFVVAERRNAALDVLETIRFKNRSIEIHEPDASFLKLHFSRFNIPNGVTVEVRSPDGRESYRYTREGGGARTLNRKAGDDGKSGFSAMSISGDTVIIEVLGKVGQINSLKNRVYIDYYMTGYPEDQLTVAGGNMAAKSTLESGGSGMSKTESVCGVDERIPAVCWEHSDPEEFDRSWPIARLLINGTKSCTAWRVGPDNYLFTNNHCVATQDDMDSVEVWFNYQTIECGIHTLEETVKVAAGTLFATHRDYDFTLFSVQDFAAIEPFGFLGLEVRDAHLGERIYIPQHGYGSPKQIAIESDMNVSGLCEVDDLSIDRYAPDTDIGYFCDTVGGSSGSPVIAGSSGRAVALHHFGGCLNSGVKMTLIWPEVSSFFGGEVPAGDNEIGDSENLPPVTQFGYTCNETTCSFDAEASSDPDGTISEFTWSFGDGATGNGMTVEHSYADAGSYIVTLTVIDDMGASDSLSQTVSVQFANQPPVAAFQVSCENLTCELDATLSSDDDGTISNYTWSFGDGTGDTFDIPIATHTFSAAGQYSVLLQVTDDAGASATADSLLTVSEPENQLPQASFVFSCVELTCDFDGSASNDTDGTIVGYTWSFGDGTGGTFDVPVTSKTFPAAGQYSVQLQVTDDDGATATTISLLTVSEPENQLPQASFTFSCTELACEFDGSASDDPDGAITSFHWEFGDGTTESGDRVNHEYGADGSYEVRLTVSDDREASNSTTRTVHVVTTVASAISLSATAGKLRSNRWVDLEWSGALSSTVDIYRNGSVLTTSDNDGSYQDSTITNRDKSLKYRVCERGTSTCSNEVTVL